MRDGLALFAHSLFRLVGLHACRHSRSFPGVRERLLRESGTSLVLDIGANIGQYARALRRNGYRGRIVSFEPLGTAFQQLRNAASSDPLWDCLNIAVGSSRRVARLNVAANSVSSSLFNMTAHHIASAAESVYIATEKVRLERLDDLLEANAPSTDPIFMKMDVQGYEDEVLNGCPRLLKRVIGVELELSLAPLYEGQALMPTLVERLSRAGFKPLTLETGFKNPLTGELLQVDAIFKRTDVLDP
jgi:FkbM family methyltransferase